MSDGFIPKLGGFYSQLKRMSNDDKLDFLNDLKSKAESAKINYSDGNIRKANCKIESCKIKITEDLWDLIMDYMWEECKKEIVKTIEVAQSFNDWFSKDSIDKVLLIGGSTNIKRISENVGKFFGSRKIANVDEVISRQLAVAQGASIEACNRLNNNYWYEIKDVCPRTLGICCKGDYVNAKGQLIIDGDHISHHIKQSTPIEKAEVNKYYYTRFDDQSDCSFDIYQGDDKEVYERNKICGFWIKNIPPRRKGMIQFGVTMRYNQFGIVEVEITIYDKENCKEISTLPQSKFNFQLSLASVKSKPSISECFCEW